MTDDPKIVTENCGCQYNKVTGVYTHLCPPCFEEVQDNPTTVNNE